MVMQELKGDLWDVVPSGYDEVWRGFTTNGVVNNSALVMGAGTAKQAKDRYPSLPLILGGLVKYMDGNIPYYIHVEDHDPVFSFPTKEHYRSKSDTALIMKSAISLANKAILNPADAFILPRPGVGLGGLDWKKVRPMLLTLLPDNVFVIDKK
jgi:hypothetical protein